MIDIYEPFFVIKIAGKILSEEETTEITELRFEDCEDEMDRLEMTVTNRKGQFDNSPLFQEGNEIEILWGYIENPGLRKKLIIKEIEPDYPESGQSTIRITAYDESYKSVNNKRRQKTWKFPPPGKRISELVAILASELGYSTEIEKTEGFKTEYAQAGLDPIEYMQELARQARPASGKDISGYVVYVEDGVLHFHPPKLAEKPILRLEYFFDTKGSLLSFRPKTNAQGAKGAGTEVKAVGIDPISKESLEHKANDQSGGARTNLGKESILRIGAAGEFENYQADETGDVVSVPFTTKEEVQTAAESKFKSKELHQMEAEATTILFPNTYIRAKNNITIEGIDQRYCGNWYLKKVTYDIIGLRCSLELRKNAMEEKITHNSKSVSGKQNQERGSKEADGGTETKEVFIIDSDGGSE